MPISQNLHFIATVAVEEEHQPPGASLMRSLSGELALGGWDLGEMDDWRDCGWAMVCRRDSAELEVVLCQIEGGRWLLQISPSQQPGAIGRLLGKKPSALPDDVHLLALAVHQALLKLECLGSPRWRWDAFPEEEHSTPEPRHHTIP